MAKELLFESNILKSCKSGFYKISRDTKLIKEYPEESTVRAFEIK